MEKKISILLASCFLFLNLFSIVKAVDCSIDVSCDSSSDDYETCLNDKISCLQAKIDDSKGKKTTLENTISIMNGNVNIKELEIKQRVAEINKLEKEIAMLGDRISGLSISLDRLTTLLVDRIRTQYKQRSSSPLDVLVSSKSLGTFISQSRYLSLASKQTAEAMQRAQDQKVIYDEQKDVKTIKQDEIETKKYQLQLEQNSLVSQRKEQQNLLDVTKNDEATFQKLLQQAQAEVSSLKSYTTNKGGSSLLGNKTSCDDWGCYYNQRDSEWGNQLIGRSNETMSSVGCLVTSAAMIASHYGKNINPSQIAASSFPFDFNTAMMRFSWLDYVNGTKVSRERICWGNSCALSSIDSELASNRPVIIRINAANQAGTHFLVITKKEGDNYIMKDPYEDNGNNRNFTDVHSLSNITAVDRVSVN